MYDGFLCAKVLLSASHRKGECTVIKAHTNAVRSVDFAFDGKLLLTASDDKSIKVGDSRSVCIAQLWRIVQLWELPSQRFSHSLTGHINWVTESRNLKPQGLCH